jgi:hypothetical protein
VRQAGWPKSGLFKLVVLSVGHCVAKVDEELCQASLSCSIVAKHVGKGGISEWFGQTLAQGLPGSVVIAQPGKLNVNARPNIGRF